MATVRMQHATGHGYDVLYDASGEGVTVTFPSQPTPEQIAEAADELDRRKTSEIEDTKVVIREE